jgi:hypothetical protein
LGYTEVAMLFISYNKSLVADSPFLVGLHDLVRQG